MLASFGGFYVLCALWLAYLYWAAPIIEDDT